MLQFRKKREVEVLGSKIEGSRGSSQVTRIDNELIFFPFRIQIDRIKKYTPIEPGSKTVQQKAHTK